LSPWSVCIVVPGKWILVGLLMQLFIVKLEVKT